MPQTEKRKAELLEKANTLPHCPGVYIMRDKTGKIIYIGKSKALHFRVSQYFQDGEKNIKTQKMVSEVWDFDIMRTDTEIEALALENKLIKLHQPKYNIRLKDAKSYPYIKVSVGDEYPRVTVTRKRSADGAKYFGPYSGMGVAWGIVKTAQKMFCIPGCKLSFPESIGKVRPCLYSHIGQCCAPCSGKINAKEYSIGLAREFSDIEGLKSESSCRQAIKWLKDEKHVERHGKMQMLPLIESNEYQRQLQTLKTKITEAINQESIEKQPYIE